MDSITVLPAILGVFIPIVAIIGGLSVGAWIIYLKYRRDTEALQLSHAERLAAIDKGMELPLPPPPHRSQTEDLREARRSRVRGQRTAGLILLFVGVTVTVGIWQTADEGYVFGMVPGSIGLALLIASILDAREGRDDS
jgi:hypothetical protein